MQDLINLLDSILGQHKKHPRGEYYYTCPFCNHSNPKLAINITKNSAWHCWHCNERGGSAVSLFKKLNCSREEFTELFKLLGTHHSIDITTISSDVSLPSEYRPLYAPPTKIDFAYKNALRYVLSRGITPNDILKYRIGFCDDGAYKNRIIIPSYDSNGKLNYFVGRSIYESSMKYKNPTNSKNIIAFEQHINWNYPIVLVEGVYDAIAVKRNAIPLLGKTIPNKLLSALYLHNVKTIYLALDNDAIKATVEIAKELIRNGIEVYKVNLDNKDPSEMGFENMVKSIGKSTPMQFTDLVRLQVNS